MTLMVDSGASETVCREDHFEDIEVAPSEGSKRATKYKDASGKAIANLGQKKVPFYTDEGDPRNMTFQACEVTKPLASVSKITQK